MSANKGHAFMQPFKPTSPGVHNTFSCFICKKFKTMIGRKLIAGTWPKPKHKCRDCHAEAPAQIANNPSPKAILSLE